MPEKSPREKETHVNFGLHLFGFSREKRGRNLIGRARGRVNAYLQTWVEQGKGEGLGVWGGLCTTTNVKIDAIGAKMKRSHKPAGGGVAEAELGKEEKRNRAQRTTERTEGGGNEVGTARGEEGSGGPESLESKVLRRSRTLKGTGLRQKGEGR